MLRKASLILSMLLPLAPLAAQTVPSPLGYDVPAPAAPVSTAGAATTATLATAPLGYDAPTLSHDVAPTSGVIALSPQAREAALREAAMQGDDSLGGGRSRGIHGEVGVEFGSHGTRALYGTTVVPLGETGSAAFSFMTASDNYRYRH